ncbi:MAG: glycosyl hydrolase [Cyclobacteriaceae bacterium]|nr:glycosyl hydrolase [Cyclobacteriaceae bacterium]
MKNSMNNFLTFILTAIIIISCSNKNKSTNGTNDVYTHVKSKFQNPETSSGVNCWWWLNRNVNKAAITKDLEAMKSRNFQGAMVFDAGGHNQRGNHDIPAGPLFGLDEWNELFVFALDEAKRLGPEIGFNIQSGWNLGGPRVTPQYTAKQITFSEAKVSESNIFSLKSKIPNTRRDFYEDIAVLAFPIVEQQKTDETITYLNLKLGFHELGGSDGIKNYGFSDIVMSEFWSPSPHRSKPQNRFYLKQASSAAHIYGKKIVGAESFTTIGPHWNDELWHDQKSFFDHEICAGLNRMYFPDFDTWVSQTILTSVESHKRDFV